MIFSDAGTVGFGVHISFYFIRYSEGEHSFELQRDPAGVAGEPAFVYVPNPARWVNKMPEWARSRRGEILKRIKNHCSHMKDKWQDF